MIYYQNPANQEVFGYDETDPTQKPYIDQAIANGWVNITGNWPPLPSAPTAEQNKATATQLLLDTDWSEIPSVNDQSLSPHLDNGAAFVAYRSAIRSIAVNPVAGDIVWPAQPKAQWSN